MVRRRSTAVVWGETYHCGRASMKSSCLQRTGVRGRATGVTEVAPGVAARERRSVGRSVEGEKRMEVGDVVAGVNRTRFKMVFMVQATEYSPSLLEIGTGR